METQKAELVDTSSPMLQRALNLLVLKALTSLLTKSPNKVFTAEVNQPR